MPRDLQAPRKSHAARVGSNKRIPLKSLGTDIPGPASGQKQRPSRVVERTWPYGLGRSWWGIQAERGRSRAEGSLSAGFGP